MAKMYCVFLGLIFLLQSIGWTQEIVQFSQLTTDYKAKIELQKHVKVFTLTNIPDLELMTILYDGDLHDVIFHGISSDKLKIWENDLLTDSSYILTSEGLRLNSKSTGIRTFDILGPNGEEGALTVSPGFVAGFYKDIYFEPAIQIDGLNLPRGILVIYKETDAVNIDNLICNDDSAPKDLAGEVEVRGTQCYRGFSDIADDYLMYVNQGSSVTNVQNWNTSKLNTTKTRYDNEFSNPIQIVIDQQYIVTSLASEPWPQNITISVLLSNFANWAYGTGGYSGKGFPSSPNYGTLWTNRSYTGPYGIAYVGEFCAWYGFHVLRQVSTLSDKLQTHEMGHVMNMAHVTGTQFYMNATVTSAATQWAAANTTSLQTYLDLSVCNKPELFCPALPIEIAKLEAYNEGCGKQGLRWVTASEYNNEKFIVQSAGSDLKFKDATIIKGKGTSFDFSSYEFQDPKPYKGINYYRILNVDYDGTQYLNPIRFVYNSCGETKILFDNFINENELSLNIQPEGQHYLIGNMLGSVLFSGELHSNSLDVSSLSAGMYFISINGETERFVIGK